MNDNQCDENNEEEKNMMPDMAKKMMSNMQNKDNSFNPKQMCESMMKSVESTAKLAGQANSEVQMLFEEWVEQVEEELLEILKDEHNFNTQNISNQLRVSEESVLYFLSKLVREKKIEILDLQIIEKGE